MTAEIQSSIMGPIVTVVIPTRDRRELLVRAIRSVLEQTISDVELIVVDDASQSDLGLSEPGLAGRLRVARNPVSVGAQQSRLIGTRMARGKFVALLDSDDWWSKDKLERQLEVAAADAGAFVSCRVTVSKGSLRKEAPWRPLNKGERVEDFLYVRRGMLQTSTVLAERNIMLSLLEESAAYNVHNDTMLFLEAQRRGLDIIQISEPLAFFDDNPRPDRISYDARRLAASIIWFNHVSPGWSVEARKGFILTDMVSRYVNAGQRGKALICLLRAYHPKLSLKLYIRQVAYVVFNGSPMRFFQREA
jgi:glycosyltransferase involved in cell wall biosynthesis